MASRDLLRSGEECRSEQPQFEITTAVHFEFEDPEITRARRDATTQGQAGDFIGAVRSLERIHELQTANGATPDCASEIRRAKYLQKAGRGEEAWQLFEELFERHKNDPWLLVDLLDAMRLHLQRETRSIDAIAFGVAMRLAQVKLYRDWRSQAETALAGPIESYGDGELEKLILSNHQRDVEFCDGWLERLTNPEQLRALAKPLCSKADASRQTEALVTHIEREIANATDPIRYLKAARFAQGF